MIGFQSQEHYFNIFVTPEDITKMNTESISGTLFPQAEKNSMLGLEARLSEDADSIIELTNSKGVIFKLDLKLGSEKYSRLKQIGQVRIQKDESEITLNDTSKLSGWALDTYNGLQQRL